jgi:hypothetical protein
MQMTIHDSALEQSDLFGNDARADAGTGETAGGPIPATKDPDSHPRDADAQLFEIALQDFRRTVADVERLLQAHRNTQGRFAGTIKFAAEALIDERCSEVFDEVLDMASEAFGGYGNRIEIDQRTARDLFFPTEDHCASRLARAASARTRSELSPVALWRFLKGRYRNTGKNQALCETAQRIVHRFPFGWRFNDSVKTTAAATTFSVAILTEKPTRSDCAFQLDCRDRYNVTGSLRHVIRDLAVFLAWAQGDHTIPREIQSDVDAIHDWMFHENGRFDSRFKQQVGPLTLQWFKDKVDFRFQAPLAEKLNLFLTEYAGAALAAAMEKRR